MSREIEIWFVYFRGRLPFRFFFREMPSLVEDFHLGGPMMANSKSVGMPGPNFHGNLKGEGHVYPQQIANALIAGLIKGNPWVFIVP